MASKTKSVLSGAGQGAAIGTSIAPGIGTAIGAIGGGLLGLFGGGESAEEKAQRERQEAYDQLKVLTPEQRAVQLAYLEDMGSLTPEMEQALTQDDTELNNIALDPAYKQAQMNTLSRLQQIGDEGLNLTDLAALNEIKRNVAEQNRGMQGAVMQNMAARGMSGGGAELAARLQAAQSAADTASQQGMTQAAQAQARALQGIMASGTFAQNMENADFGRQSAKASAQDAINRFNTSNAQGVMSTNTAVRNNAAKYNLDYRKDLAENRQATTNAQRKQNSQDLKDFTTETNNNILGRAGVGVDAARAADAGAQSRAQAQNDMINGIGGMAANFFGKKKDKDDEDEGSNFGTLLGGFGDSNSGGLV